MDDISVLGEVTLSFDKVLIIHKWQIVQVTVG